MFGLLVAFNVVIGIVRNASYYTTILGENILELNFSVILVKNNKKSVRILSIFHSLVIQMVKNL